MHEEIQKIRETKEKLDTYLSLLREREILERENRSTTAIDHDLDTFDDDLQASFETLWQDYLQRHHPELWKKHSDWKQKKELLQPLSALFQKGLALQQQKLFIPLFGRHPKVVLAHYLHEAEKLIKNALLHLSEDDPFHSLLTTLLQEIARPWNPALYSTTFPHLALHFSSLYSDFEQEETLLTTQLRQIEELLSPA